MIANNIHSKKKRSKEEIIASILDSARKGASKTRIMYGSFLSFNQLQKYLDYTLQARLVDLSYSGKYVTTSKGLEYLKRFEEVQDIESDVTEKRRLLWDILRED